MLRCCQSTRSGPPTPRAVTQNLGDELAGPRVPRIREHLVGVVPHREIPPRSMGRMGLPTSREEPNWPATHPSRLRRQEQQWLVLTPP
jgi:hypothetical protein